MVAYDGWDHKIFSQDGKMRLESEGIGDRAGVVTWSGWIRWVGLLGQLDRPKSQFNQPN
jgi:hypothetical protein